MSKHSTKDKREHLDFVIETLKQYGISGTDVRTRDTGRCSEHIMVEFHHGGTSQTLTISGSSGALAQAHTLRDIRRICGPLPKQPLAPAKPRRRGNAGACERSAPLPMHHGRQKHWAVNGMSDALRYRWTGWTS